eukprot:m.516063 g.516063  ORF g.516063 m.516063 type:complete len:233 (-) comp57470_c0_seq1:1245-1943(-)
MGVLETSQDFVDVLKLTNGRDKLMRIIQYGARFFGNSPRFQTLAAQLPFKALEANISAARKLFRLFRTIDFALLALNSLKEVDPILRVIKVVDNLSKAFRMLLDNLHWAVKIGLLKGNEPLLNWYMMVFWFLGLLLGTVQSTYVLSNLMKKEKLLRRQHDLAGAEALRVRQARAVLDIARDTLDMPTPLHSLQVIAPHTTSTVGLCGALASIIAFHQVWQDVTAKKYVSGHK